MRVGVMAMVCVLAMAGMAVGGCSGNKKNPFLPFFKAASKSTRQPMVRTAADNSNPIEDLFKQTPAQKRQQTKAWKNMQKFVSDALFGAPKQTVKR